MFTSRERTASERAVGKRATSGRRTAQVPGAAIAHARAAVTNTTTKGEWPKSYWQHLLQAEDAEFFVIRELVPAAASRLRTIWLAA